MIDIDYESLIPFLMLLSAFYGFKASKNHKYKTSLILASSAFIVMFVSYIVPIIGALSIKATSVNSMESLEEYSFFLEQVSSIIMFIGFSLLSYSMYTFGKRNENV